MVSVIIPYHNNEYTLERAVRSVLEQTYKNLEVIIVDNGSDEPLKTENELYMDPRVRTYITPELLGASGARNAGIKLATGEYIAFLDADDYWEKDKLDKQLKVMERFRYKGEAPVICFTGRELVDENGNKLGRYIGCNKIVDYKMLLRSNQINCSSVLIKASVLGEMTFPKGNLHEDYVLWLRLLQKGGYAAGINRPLLNYRVSSKSKSGNKLKSAMMNFRVYRYLGFGLFETMLHMLTYTLAGIKKHYL